VFAVRDWLKAIRERRGLTQRAVAELAGISQPAYHNIEAGKRNPSINTAKAIAKVLKFKWTRFFR
jgi:transcriptional regulator with XRE-family HTH domain